MLSWVFRPQCAGCGALADRPLCVACEATLEPVTTACARCAEPGASLCRRCSIAPLAIAQIIAPWKFGGQLAVAIRRLKLSGATHVARALAPLWAPIIIASHADLVVPVPSHWRRRFARGFDHAWLLADHACRLAGTRATPALRRIRHAPPQRGLTAMERRENLADAFATRLDVAGRSVLLLDDVCTTGATLAACAQPLLAAGAKTVTGLALARATSVP